MSGSRLHALILREIRGEVVPSSCLLELRHAGTERVRNAPSVPQPGRGEGGSDLDVLFLEMRPQLLPVLPFERLSSPDLGRKAPVTVSSLNVTQK